jgi:3'-phosphoadenosine 5'-phosphosulfate sulfotransferase (PAPS reductase)/FAD synthetase
MKTTLKVIEFLKTQTDSVVLFYSGGKDSIILLDLLSKHFTVHLAFMYFVPGLRHIENYVAWAEKKYGCKVKMYPHWMLSQYYNDNYFRFHSNPVAVLKLKDIEAKAKYDFNCDWIVSGIKKADSLNRRLMLNTYLMSSINLDGKKAYPLAEWNKAECMAYIRTNRLPKPISYKNENSSGADLNKDFLLFCKAKYPNDYKKILVQFPFAETIIHE